jgi:hypothetical protein
MGCGKPDGEAGSHDAQIVDRIADDMDQDTHHSKIAMVMAMTVPMAVTAGVGTVMFLEM